MNPTWEQLYLEARTPWEKGAPAPPLLEWLDRHSGENHPGRIAGSILVPGCGLGHDVRALAKLSDGEKIVGIDISPTALKKAEKFETRGVEEYHQADLFDLGPEHQSAYDWIWEHTCFCAIDPERRGDYVDAVWHALKPGGTLLGVFFLDPYDEDHGPGQGPPHGTTVYELKARFANTGRFRIEDLYVPKRTYDGREDREVVMRMTRLDPTSA